MENLIYRGTTKRIVPRKKTQEEFIKSLNIEMVDHHTLVSALYSEILELRIYGLCDIAKQVNRFQKEFKKNLNEMVACVLQNSKAYTSNSNLYMKSLEERKEIIMDHLWDDFEMLRKQYYNLLTSKNIASQEDRLMISHSIVIYNIIEMSLEFTEFMKGQILPGKKYEIVDRTLLNVLDKVKKFDTLLDRIYPQHKGTHEFDDEHVTCQLNIIRNKINNIHEYTKDYTLTDDK